MRITFRCEQDDGEVIIFQTASDIDSYELLQDFERFMKCCSYEFDGSVEIVPEEIEDEYEEPVQKNTVWDWTVNELIKNSDRNQVEQTDAPVKTFFDNEYCPLCGIETKLMRHEQCYDTYCPKTNDAYQR
jgi:hypothetical protein